MSVGVRKGGEPHKAQTGGQRLTKGVCVCVSVSVCVQLSEKEKAYLSCMHGCISPKSSLVDIFFR